MHECNRNANATFVADLCDPPHARVLLHISLAEAGQVDDLKGFDIYTSNPQIQDLSIWNVVVLPLNTYLWVKQRSNNKVTQLLIRVWFISLAAVHLI